MCREERVNRSEYMNGNVCVSVGLSMTLSVCEYE